jgi:hypothetical protein
MNGMFSEHAFNSFLPKYPSQVGRGVLETGVRLRWVPRHARQNPFSVTILQIPSPNHRVEPQAQGCCSFRTFVFPGLQFLAADELLGISESVPDAPTAGKTFDHLAAPRRIDPQGQNHQIQPLGMNYFFARRPYRVAPPAGSIQALGGAAKRVREFAGGLCPIEICVLFAHLFITKTLKAKRLHSHFPPPDGWRRNEPSSEVRW